MVEVLEAEKPRIDEAELPRINTRKERHYRPARE
jgi:hypothetical protein